MRRLVIAAALVALAAPVAWPQDAKPAGLKVRKIVLYKHGVGYFEREGKVAGSQQVALSFKSAQMKDLLKSLFAVDLDGGRVSTIMYDTKDPLSKQLEDVLIRVPEGNALTAFLAQLKGARIEIVSGGETTKGSIVGIEPVSRQLKEGIVTSYKLVIFREDGKLVQVDLLEMTSLKLLDEPLQKDLQRILDIHLKSKYADRKSVTLNCTGEGDRRIRVGYIVETPIWKTSYRLLFEEGAKPLLQGWAILENPSDEDWEDVEVSFVAGAPISFSMDLYTAYYVRRPEVAVTAHSGARPDQDSGLADKGYGGGNRPAAAPAPGKALERRKMEDLKKKDARSADHNEAGEAEDAEAFSARRMEESFAPVTEGVQVGEMFAYRSKERVSVKRGQAALVPILSERLDSADRVLYYRSTFNSRPANAVKFKNTTALTLEAGPVTFYDGSTCVGEGLIKRIMKTGMADVIPYAFESSITVTPKSEYRQEAVTTGRIANGVLWLTQTQVQTTTYEIRNQGTKDATLWLDHPATGGFTLAEPAKADEDIEAHHRFKVEAKTGKTQELVIREKAPLQQTVSLIGTPAETIRWYINQKYLSDKAKAFLESLLGLLVESSKLQSEMQALERERQQLEADQNRARQNLNVLRDRPDEIELRKKYLKRLEDAEQRIEEITLKVREKAEKKAALDADLAKKVREYTE